jgi:uncharacterized protein YpmB
VDPRAGLDDLEKRKKDSRAIIIIIIIIIIIKLVAFLLSTQCGNGPMNTEGSTIFTTKLL